VAITLLSICTDEDVSIRAHGDFPLIAPDQQRLSEGSDGAIAAADPWSLVSASSDFTALGVTPGAIAILDEDRPADHPSKFSDDELVVASVPTGKVTLRRIGMAAGVGVPPGKATDITGVTFRIPTVQPQINRATYEVQRRAKVYSAADLQDPNDLREAIVLLTLADLYFDAARISPSRNDEFMTKREELLKELAGEYAWLNIEYGPGRLGAQAVSAPMDESADPSLFPGWPTLPGIRPGTSPFGPLL
jgi:hypothetical protein